MKYPRRLLRTVALVIIACLPLVASANRAARADSPDTTSPQTVFHLLATARYGEAVSAANDLIQQAPGEASSYQARGAVDLTVGDFGLARHDWKLADQQAPRVPATEYGLALCALAERDFHAAETLLAQAHQGLDPDDPSLKIINDAQYYCRYEQGDASADSAGAGAAPDSLSGEVRALLMAQREPAAGRLALERWLATTSGAPQVHEDSGIRLRIEDAGPAIQASPTDPSVRAMYLASLDEQANRLARSTGRPQLASDVIYLSAPASCPPTTALVSFSVDGQMAGMVNTRPYRYGWNTRLASNGLHTVQIEAMDQAGNIVVSQSKIVRVENSRPETRAEAAPDSSTEAELWSVLALRPSRTIAEWTLADLLDAQGDKDGALLHRAVAAALDLQFRDSRRYARELLAAAVAPATAVPKLAGAGAHPAEGVYMGSPNKPWVALTFDDGPNPMKTPLLLNALDAAKAPATFFVVGSRAEESPDIIRRMAARGDDVEDHSYAHPNLALCTIDTSEAEILRATLVIRALAGRAPRFFRPPGGDISPAVIQLAHDYGQAGGFWTMDGITAEDSGSEKQLVQFVVGYARSGAIVLLHNGTDVTTAAIPQIVAGLRRRGFTLVTLRQMVSGNH